MGIRLKNDDVTAPNLRLKQLGYDSLGELTQAVTKGIISNRQLVEELAEVVADKVVNKLLTSAQPKGLPLNMVRATIAGNETEGAAGGTRTHDREVHSLLCSQSTLRLGLLYSNRPRTDGQKLRFVALI